VAAVATVDVTESTVRVRFTRQRWTGLLISVDDAARVAAELATAE